MSGPREVELKYALEGPEDFELLLALAPAGASSAPERQTNHYFDTADLALIGRRIMLRARSGDGLFLTLKAGAEVAPGCFDSLELESTLAPAELERILAEPGCVYEVTCPARDELLRRIGRVPLVYLGALENERFRRRLGEYVLELDRLTFPGGEVTHELEVELPAAESAAAADREVRAELDRRGVRFRVERLTKLERLLGRQHAGG